MPKRWRKPKAQHQQSKRRRFMPSTGEGTGTSSGALGGLRGGLKKLAGTAKHSRSGPPSKMGKILDIALWGAIAALAILLLKRQFGS